MAFHVKLIANNIREIVLKAWHMLCYLEIVLKAWHMLLFMQEYFDKGLLLINSF